MDKQDIKLIKEGLVEIQVPKFDKVSSRVPVFYNPKMEFNRDISILALQTFQEEVNRRINVCDVFGGSGIRAIRYKKEISGVNSVAVNDISSMAIEQSKKNSIANNVKIELYQEEANILLREKQGIFDVVDIDPFGTPSYFLDSAAYSLKKDSLLCVTATDTSALCGTYKEPCIRKYNAKPCKNEYCHENGIRILTGFIALTFAKYKKYIEDIKFSYSNEHYIRIYIKSNKSSTNTDESLADDIGYVTHCKKCLYREIVTGLVIQSPNFCSICKEKFSISGPMWIGKIQNSDFIAKMIEKIDENNLEKKKLNTEKRILKLLNSCLEEANAPITFYDIHLISKNLKISVPKLTDIMNRIKKEGFLATKTHFNPIGIKSDIGIEKLKDIINSLAL